MSFFDGHSEKDFLRTGGIAHETVTLESGPLPEFSHAMEPQLRQLGMPTELQKGVIHLIKEYTVCQSGDKLNSEQARILKLLGHQQANFKLNMIAVWNKDEGSFKMLREDFSKEDEDEEQSDNDEENNESMDDE